MFAGDERLRVKRLEVRDFKRIGVAVMECDEAWNVVGGRNAQGKSSLLDAIEGAMRGKKAMPAEPIRRGAERCEIVADLGEIVVKRVTTAKTDRLVVTNAEGFERKRPQELLDALWGGVAIDPLEFQRLTPAKQAERMLAVLGLDFAELDAERKGLYDERTLANRQAKDAQAVADAKPRYADAPKEPVSVKDAAAELAAARAHNAQADSIRRAVDVAEEQVQRAKRMGEGIKSEIEEIEGEISRLQERLALRKASLEEHRAEYAKAKDAKAKAEAELAAFEPMDTAAIEAKMQDAEDANAKLAANREAKEAEAVAQKYADDSAELTRLIEAIDAEKAEKTAAAEFPVDGLAFGPDGLLLNGLPFAQASSAEKWRVSIAAGISQKPKLAVLLIRDGEKLDADSREIVRQMAVESGCQIFVEDCRATGEEATVVIEDGAIQS